MANVPYKCSLDAGSERISRGGERVYAVTKIARKVADSINKIAAAVLSSVDRRSEEKCGSR